MTQLAPVTLAEVRAARERLGRLVVRTPLLRLPADVILDTVPDTGPATAGEGPRPEIFLKPENLQPIGAFKLRGAANAIAQAPSEQLAAGVWTASAGNMAQGVAWCARDLGVSCRVVVPDHAPQAKLEAIARLGAEVVRVPLATWVEVFVRRSYPGMEGLFIHPFSDPAVMAGNGTIALEIAEDLPDVDTVIVPYGGGGLACGIAAALRELRPEARVYACEVATAAPLAASLAAGRPTEVAYERSFVDGIGAPRVFPEMFALARTLLAGSLVVTPAQAAAALRLLLERNRLLAEGAGAAAVAAALAHPEALGRKVVCVISGGNIDSAVVAAILQGELPPTGAPADG